MNGAINKIRTELIQAFDQAFDVFSTREDVLYYKPANEGWSIYQVLEHVLLANYFLLRIVNKQTERAMQLAATSKVISDPDAYKIDEAKLKRMELTGSYVWVSQRFTEPVGDMPLLQLKMTLHDQVNEILGLLKNRAVIDANLKTFETGKIDALHYLYFLVQHMQRHLGQISRIKAEFYQLQKHIAHTDNIRVAKSICLN